MAIKLNQAGFEHAEKLIKHGFEVEHDADNWDEVKPDRDDKVRFLNTHDLDEYGLWFLGIDTDIDSKDAARFVYPTGDFNVIQKSGLLDAEQKAKQEKHTEIQNAVQKLLHLLGE